jgi:hypothetical protein
MVESQQSPGTGLSPQQGCAFGIRGGVVTAGGVAIPWLPTHAKLTTCVAFTNVELAPNQAFTAAHL